MMSVKKYGWILLLAGFFYSCGEEVSAPSSGTADFTNYISVGNSLTAGYSDGGLYRAAQLNSYPAILAGQMRSGLSFIQPLMPEGNGSGYIKLLAYSEDGFPTIKFLDQDPRAFDKMTGPYHNLGVPGIRVKDIEMKNYGTQNNNEYFYRMLPAGSESNTSYLDLIAESEPTFFTCWMGNNDVLGYATEGGFYGEDGTWPYERSGLTDISEFQSKFNLLIEALTEDDAKGVVLTIPDILYIPYFNLVTNEYFPNLTSTQLLTLNKQYSEANALIEEHNEKIQNDESLTEEEKEALYRETIVFESTGNSFIIEDKDLPDIGVKDSKGNAIPKMRRLKEGEKITVPGILEITGTLAGIYEPLGDRYVLTLNEMELIGEYREAYNTIIKNAAADHGIALLDIDELLEEYIAGKTVDGVLLSTEFIEGGIFSLDGIHLTQRGYALVANEIVNKINSVYNAELPRVNISQYPAVDIP